MIATTYQTPHNAPVIVDVDASGAAPNGETYGTRANPQHVFDGLVVERAVVLRGPDGSLSMGSQVRVTPSGIAAGLNV